MEFGVRERAIAMMLKEDMGLVVEGSKGWLGYLSTAPQGASVMKYGRIGERPPLADSEGLERWSSRWRWGVRSRRATRLERKWSRRWLHGALGNDVRRRFLA